MDPATTNVLLITANVGSMFEDPERMLKMWLGEFLKQVHSCQPDFLAVHCQEVGGKNYEESMHYVNDFIKAILSNDALDCYDKTRVFLDEDFTAADKFTALGNLYFIHESVKNVQMYDFIESKFVSINGKEVLSGNIESVSLKEKAKFPKDFFPECKWSRKGFIRTRWSINSTQFDIINIHLFHDASNLISMEASPSTYVANRRRALEYTINRIASDQHENVPFFMFGDFNFRLDTQLLVKRLTEKTVMHSTLNKRNELSKLVYRDSNNTNRTVLTIEKKAFDHHEKHDEIFNSYMKWLHEYDNELDYFRDRVHEFELDFPPSYPFSEDTDDGCSYMKTRCPAWCDRIIMSHDAIELMPKQSEAVYNMIGPTTCMGDHKPIYLHFKMKQGAARVPPSTRDITTPSINSEELYYSDHTTAHVPSTQVRITHIENTKYIHVRRQGSRVRVFRETSV
ncbi:inositol polyphosphate-5-phosphatase A-like [Tubulanus polymorphus]|uniref:inositol polyphosphate-5-phosphatase A-like n=1 Tax=Tubulanus polymorphus TaxID=672921 RepID=UPI003DA28269